MLHAELVVLHADDGDTLKIKRVELNVVTPAGSCQRHDALGRQPRP